MKKKHCDRFCHLALKVQDSILRGKSKGEGLHLTLLLESNFLLPQDTYVYTGVIKVFNHLPPTWGHCYVGNQQPLRL